MENKYESLDKCILNAIKHKKNPLHDPFCSTESDVLAAASSPMREAFRVLDGRLQAMRKAGKIQFVTKAEAKNSDIADVGWVIPQRQFP
jgi:hypothetical protein